MTEQIVLTLTERHLELIIAVLGMTSYVALLSYLYGQAKGYNEGLEEAKEEEA